MQQQRLWRLENSTRKTREVFQHHGQHLDQNAGESSADFIRGKVCGWKQCFERYGRGKMQQCWDTCLKVPSLSVRVYRWSISARGGWLILVVIQPRVFVESTLPVVNWASYTELQHVLFFLVVELFWTKASRKVIKREKSAVVCNLLESRVRLFKRVRGGGCRIKRDLWLSFFRHHAVILMHCTEEPRLQLPLILLPLWLNDCGLQGTVSVFMCVCVGWLVMCVWIL